MAHMGPKVVSGTIRRKYGTVEVGVDLVRKSVTGGNL